MKAKYVSNETAYNVKQSNPQSILDITHGMTRENTWDGGWPMRGNRDRSKTPPANQLRHRNTQYEGQKTDTDRSQLRLSGLL